MAGLFREAGRILANYRTDGTDRVAVSLMGQRALEAPSNHESENAMESGKTPETPKPGSSGQTGMTGGPTPKRIDAPTAVSSDTASLTDTAKQAASQVASKASEWTDQAKSAAGEAVSGLRERAEDLVSGQKSRGADFLTSISRAADAAARELHESSPYIADQVTDMARGVDSLSRNVRERSVGDMMRNLNEFARREPTAFLAGSVIAGFMISRFLKASAERREMHAGAYGYQQRGMGQRSGTGQSGMGQRRRHGPERPAAWRIPGRHGSGPAFAAWVNPAWVNPEWAEAKQAPPALSAA